jgi:hypothetical protein
MRTKTPSPPRCPRNQRPSPQILSLAQLLEPFLYEQELTGWFFHDDREGMEDMRRWIRRFIRPGQGTV